MKCILIIDESISKREHLYDLLVDDDRALITSRSSSHALGILRHEQPDLILANIQLSDKPFESLVRDIRSRCKRVPIVFYATGEVTSTLLTQDKRVQIISGEQVDDENLKTIVRQWLDERSADGQLTRGTILVADDDPHIRAILKEFFNRRHFKVKLAPSGEDVLEQLQHYTPVAVILDVRMPGKSGLEVLEEIKKTKPQLPIVIISAFSEEDTVKTVFKLGALECLNKPLDLKQLGATIDDLAPTPKL